MISLLLKFHIVINFKEATVLFVFLIFVVSQIMEIIS